MQFGCNFSYMFAVGSVVVLFLVACNFSTEEAQAMELQAVSG
jgi:hypothetical protein